VPLLGVLRRELVAAVRALTRKELPILVASTVRIEGGGAVRADDAQVVKPVVGRVPVDVIQDQRDLVPVPELALATEFAQRLLEALLVESALEGRAAVRRVLDENLLERDRALADRSGVDGLLAEVVRRDIPLGGPLLGRLVIAARDPHAEQAQRGCPAVRGSNGRSGFGLRESRPR
jgi:hypothetical protein